ncbi:MAG: glycosyl transferase, partial [Chloroflexi bacterium]
WYENSPIVIQEAFASRTPVICSGIGGMAEKVEDGVTGLHVRHGDARDLADTMVKAATTVGLRERLSEAIPAMPDMSRSVGSHLELYGSPAE